jgi:hypothetical protein
MWLRHEAAGQGHDRSGHGGREEHGVPGGRRLGEELLDVGQEPEVEHLVGLVENHLAHIGEIEQTLACEVEQAARGADDDLRAGLQLFDLALVGLAPVDGDDRGGPVRRGEHEVFGHLHGELACRNDDERLHAVLGGEPQALDERKAEPEGLARSRLGLADDVLAVEGQGDRLGLDGERLEDALAGECVCHVLVDA